MYVPSGRESERQSYEDSSVVQGFGYPTNQLEGLRW